MIRLSYLIILDNIAKMFPTMCLHLLHPLFSWMVCRCICMYNCIYYFVYHLKVAILVILEETQ